MLSRIGLYLCYLLKVELHAFLTSVRDQITEYGLTNVTVSYINLEAVKKTNR